MIRRPPRSTLFPYTRSSDLPRETPRDVEAIYAGIRAACDPAGVAVVGGDTSASRTDLLDRKSTGLNSSHSQISYAVFCLKKKKSKRPECVAYRLHTGMQH